MAWLTLFLGAMTGLGFGFAFVYEVKGGSGVAGYVFAAVFGLLGIYLAREAGKQVSSLEDKITQLRSIISKSDVTIAELRSMVADEEE